VPEVGEQEVLVKIRGCVTCPHWDITLFRGIDIFDRPGHPRYPIPPGYPGHEASGEVVAVGPGVNTLKVGDRVASVVTAGERSPGFYAEYINRPEDTVAKIPDNVSWEAAASLEMARYVASHVRVVDWSGLRAGVIGLGPAGLIAVQHLQALGAREVVAIDVLEQRLALAKKLGAADTLNSTREVDRQKLVEQPLQASVDCSGAAAGLQVALDHTRGPVVVFGVVHGEAKFGTRHWRQRTWIPERKSPTADDTEFVLNLWREGRLDTDTLVSTRLPFAEYARGIGMLIERQAIKVYYYPGT
ncbi:MAG: zinc-binding dehydrogenase, partial [Chloroflexi bacterium]|nr:zinc-binding dehydrogenase [Chloroflexota bacterium]